jgi:hypothetical protein
MEELLTGDIWRKVGKHFRINEELQACVAYVTKDTLPLKHGDTLICDASKSAIENSRTSALVLQKYYDRGVQILSCDCLHAKMLVGERLLVLGSANCSVRSADTLVEAAVITDNGTLVSQAKVFCYNLARESKLLTASAIKKLLMLPIKRRPEGIGGKKSTTRNKQFGSNSWFIRTFPLSERAQEKVSDEVADSTQEIAAKTGYFERDIAYVSWKLDSTLGKSVKPGDELIIRRHDDRKTNSDSVVFEPVTVLKREKSGSKVLIYYKFSSRMQETPWSDFMRVVLNEDISDDIGTRFKQLTKTELETLRALLRKRRK